MFIASTIVMAGNGCAVGPNFQPPPVAAPGAYTREDLPAQTQATDVAGGAAQRLEPGGDLPGEWWRLFGSATLEGLIKEAMANYPDIAAQQAALRTAWDVFRAGEGAFMPQLQGNTSGSREQQSGAGVGPGYPGYITNIFQATVNVSYTLDVFGGERRLVEGLGAQAEAQNFQLEASYLTLASNLASSAIELASIREQIAVTNEIIALEEKQLATIRRQFELGSRTRADVLQQQSNLATVRATLPALQQQRATAEHQLAVLTGRLPSDAVSPDLDLSDLTLPADLPISLPSELVAQRPDIRAQTAVLHQASAAIGVATANMLPQLTLSGAIGGESLRFGNLLQPGSGVWNLAAAVGQPIFAGGTLRARRRAAIDSYDQALAQYRLIVLKAFQNVADSLTALDNDAQALKAEYDAVNAAKSSLELIERQYDAGAINYVSLLTAQQTYQQARIAYVRALASRFTDTVTLFQALGGGWWNRSDPGTLHAADARSSRVRH